MYRPLFYETSKLIILTSLLHVFFVLSISLANEDVDSKVTHAKDLETVVLEYAEPSGMNLQTRGYEEAKNNYFCSPLYLAPALSIFLLPW